MLKKIKADSELGLQIVKKGVRDLIHRSVEEVDSIKVRLEIRKIEKELDELTLQAGKMLFERLQKGKSSLEDPDLHAVFTKAAQLKDEMDILRSDLSERLRPSSE
jgi:hypothetical protein